MNDPVPPMHLLLALAVAAAVVFGLVFATGNVSSSHRFVDDNQIFQLNRLFAEDGFVETSSSHMANRIFDSHRLVPVYLIHKLVMVRILGSSLIAWSLYAGLLGTLSTFVLYCACRRMNLNNAEAFGFIVIVVLGEQSVLWWRLLHGEGPGLLLLAVSLYAMARGAHSGSSRAWDILFVVAAILASLCKESFIILIPALCYWRMWMVQERQGLAIPDALRRDRVLFGVLLAVMVAELAIIKFAFNKTDFLYTGWQGFDMADLARILGQTFRWRRAWIVAGLAGLSAIMLLLAPKDAETNSRPGLPSIFSRPVILAVLIIVPQMLLYMSSGFEGAYIVSMSRYLVPATIGLAVLAIFPIKAVREYLEQRSKNSPAAMNTRVLKGVAAALVLLLFVHRGAVAVNEGREFARFTKARSRYVQHVSGLTDPESEIAIAFGVDDPWTARQWSIFLMERYDRPNLTFLAIDPGRSIKETFETIRSNPYRSWGSTFFFKNIDSNAVAASTYTGYPDVVVVLWAPEVERDFLRVTGRWLTPDRYSRIETEYQESIYTKRTEASSSPEPG